MAGGHLGQQGGVGRARVTGGDLGECRWTTARWEDWSTDQLSHALLAP
ncbi:hypothetical protein ACQEVF_09895 [Nonomuraea polychroma]